MSKKILAVDDSVSIRKSISFILGQEGYEIVEAVDGVTMMPVDKIEKDTLVAMAVYIGKTRLIDNFSYEI